LTLLPSGSYIANTRWAGEIAETLHGAVNDDNAAIAGTPVVEIPPILLVNDDMDTADRAQPDVAESKTSRLKDKIANVPARFRRIAHLRGIAALIGQSTSATPLAESHSRFLHSLDAQPSPANIGSSHSPRTLKDEKRPFVIRNP